MRLIKQVIRALIGILLNKKTLVEYDMPINRQQTTGEDPLARLIALADAGKICQAENELFERMNCLIFWRAVRIWHTRRPLCSMIT